MAVAASDGGAGSDAGRAARGPRLVVAGTVRGTVRVKERVVVHATGQVFAEIFTPTLVVVEGGVVEGPVHMTRPDRVEAADS